MACRENGFVFVRELVGLDGPDGTWCCWYQVFDFQYNASILARAARKNTLIFYFKLNRRIESEDSYLLTLIRFTRTNCLLG